MQDQIKAELKEAMMAKDAVRLDTIRAILSAFTNELVAKGRKPQDALTDEEAIAVITKLAKQRKDSIAQYKTIGRDELVAEEEAQLRVLEKYLPTLMSMDEVMAIAKAKQTELGITDGTKKGMLMAAIMKDLKGKADGGVVKEAVDGLFT